MKTESDVTKLFHETLEEMKHCKPNTPEWELSWNILEAIKRYLEEKE